jgi:hypothetical protein
MKSDRDAHRQRFEPGQPQAITYGDAAVAGVAAAYVVLPRKAAGGH